MTKSSSSRATGDRTWPGVADIDKPVLEGAHHSAAYWIKGAREIEDRGEAVHFAEQAVNVWKNAAAHFARLLNSRPSVPSEIPKFEEAKKAIAWANNSLYGSHGYFLSDCGGPANEHHLDAPIENLKADCNRWYRAASPYATPEALAEALSALSATRRIAKVDLACQNDPCSFPYCLCQPHAPVPAARAPTDSRLIRIRQRIAQWQDESEAEHCTMLFDVERIAHE